MIDDRPMEYIREIKTPPEKVLEIGQKVLIRPAESQTGTYYYSNIQDMDAENIYIAVPSDEKGRPVGFSQGEKVLVSITAKGRRFGFSSEVTGRKTKPFFMIAIRKPEKIFVVELRQYFRVPVFVPYMAKRVERLETPEGVKYEPNRNLKLNELIVKGYIHDISGGGAFITADKRLEVGEHILIKARLDDATVLADTPARVVRKAMLDPVRKKEGYGVMFVDIEEKFREQIIRFCFKRQRELRRAGEL